MPIRSLPGHTRLHPVGHSVIAIALIETHANGACESRQRVVGAHHGVPAGHFQGDAPRGRPVDRRAQGICAVTGPVGLTQNEAGSHRRIEKTPRGGVIRVSEIGMPKKGQPPLPLAGQPQILQLVTQERYAQ